MLHTRRLRGSFVLLAVAAIALTAGCGDTDKDTGTAPASGETTSEKVETAVKDGMDKAGAVAKDVAEKTGELAGKAGEMAKEAGAVAKEKGAEVAEATKGAVHELAKDVAEATAPVNAAAEFSLPDPSGAQHALSDYRGKVVVLEWINHGCPFVKKHYGSGNLPALQKKYTDQGVVWLSICSSAEGKQGYHAAADWPKVNEKHASAATHVLLDPAGTVGRLYGAKTTPHMFVIGAKGELIYDGAIDDNDSADAAVIPTSKSYVSEVLDAVLAGKASPHSKTKPYGCGVKYAAQN